MSEIVRQEIYEAISSIRLVDPHTHINPHAPASTTLADILGYHYYTELAHSAGMAKADIEQEGIGPKELVRRLVGGLDSINNTANYRWLVQLCQKFFGFESDRIDASNWESLYASAEDRMAAAEWPQMVLDQSNVQSVFLTNDFDDPLEGFDTETYIPCLRTDDLVFHLAKPETQARLVACTGIHLDGSLGSLRDALQQRFEHFVGRGARACAISIPPTFEPQPVTDGRAGTALDHVLRQNMHADPSHVRALSRRVFWTLAELCDEYSLPFDLMIGVNRGVYADGVYQGQDLYDSRVSLTQYRELFNAFPDVKFPISILASVTNQELVSHAWIFPNVYTNGHWWYSNTPSFIVRDAHARLEAVPRNKQVGYYSDAYKLEFVWPKFEMYRQILARVLTDHFIVGSGWTQEQAIGLAKQVLRGNVDTIFARPGETPEQTETPEQITEAVGVVESAVEDHQVDEEPQHLEDTIVIEPEVAATSASLAAGAIGMVPVDPVQPETERPSLEDVIPEPQAEVEDTWVEEIESSADEQSEYVEETLDEVADSPPEEQEVDDQVVGAEPSWPAEPDPLPTAEEISQVDVEDVELSVSGGEPLALDAEAIESLADDEPLDIGEVFSEDVEEVEESVSQVVPLEGDASFAPDEESLQLQPDPNTGEWTMSSEPSDDDDEEFILDDLDGEEN